MEKAELTSIFEVEKLIRDLRYEQISSYDIADRIGKLFMPFVNQTIDENIAFKDRVEELTQALTVACTDRVKALNKQKAAEAQLAPLGTNLAATQKELYEWKARYWDRENAWKTAEKQIAKLGALIADSITEAPDA